MSTFNENLEALLNGEGPQGEMLTAAPTMDEFIARYGVVLYYLNLYLNGMLGDYMTPETEPFATWMAGEPWESFEDMMAAGQVALYP